MKVISGISVEGFRSIRSADISNLGDLTAIAGLNNSGKSNLLRALNAFFRGEVEPGNQLDLGRDYYRPDLRKKKARRIRVSVRFSLPSTFNFRKDLEHVKSILGTDFEITKEWSRRHDGVAYFLNGQPLDLEPQRRVEQFLQLINFRYVPNRVLPIDLIRDEHRALRDALVRRVAKKAKGSEATFESLRETSVSLISSMVERVQTLQPDAGKVRLATPTSWRDMIFAFGYMLDQDGTELEDILQGSGLQSLLMLETLYLIDQDYFQKFGWRQAAVWAIEEPESSLHTSLEVQVAALLQRIASVSASRLQILCTTHSDLMIQYADGSLFAEGTGTGTSFSAPADRRTALDRASHAGISRWVHPLLYFPLDPLILVEGSFDRVFIEEAFRVLRPTRPVRIADLADLGESDSGGVEKLLAYVKQNAAAIRARAYDSPVIVVLDWDASTKAPAFEKPFSASDPYKVTVWSEGNANPMLGASFRGIERFYPDRLVEAAESAGFPIARTASGVASIESSQYGALKQWLNAQVAAEGLTAGDLGHAESFLRDLLTACGAGN